jgi:hypothetical protein
MNKNQIINRIDELLAIGIEVKATEQSIGSIPGKNVDHGKIKGFRTAVLSFIELQYGRGHTHYDEFAKAVTGNSDLAIHAGLAILQAIRGEIAGGWLTSVKSLVAAEIFSDFLEMASHLLQMGYKDTAAVMIGSTLEEHLRQLARSAGVPVERDVEGSPVAKKAEQLNADLVKAEIYSKLDQKAVTTWLDLRNKAAHGKYDEYEARQVEIMNQGVIEFISRVAP